MSVPFEVQVAWGALLEHLRLAPADGWMAQLPMEAVGLLNDYMIRGLEVDGLWQPVPMDVPLTVRGELFCTAHALNPNKVWLVVASPEGRARLLLPDSVRLYYRSHPGEGGEDG